MYVLMCADGSFYIGKTNNIVRRIRQHNGEIKGGAKYTRSKRPVALYYLEKCSSEKEATEKEFLLKKLSHKEKEKLKITKVFLPEVVE